MAPVDVPLLATAFVSAKYAMNSGLDAAISAAIGDFSGITGYAIGVGIRYFLSRFNLSPKQIAMLIAIHVEYGNRTGRLSSGRGLSGMLLKNKCSKCGFRGHNKSNHPPGFKQMLRELAGLGDDFIEEMESIMDV